MDLRKCLTFFRLILIKLCIEFGKWIPDATYLKIVYYLKTGTNLSLKHPKTFNEKLQWLKLYNRKSEYSMMVDKVAVKEYVKRIIGSEYIIPTLGVWDNPDDINFDQLPKQFVLKCNHNSGNGMYICRDKTSIDARSVISNLKKGLKENYYKKWREWPYKNVCRKVLAEKFMVDESGTELKDYKIFCFNGEPEIVEVDYNRFVNHKRNLYDKNWNFIDMSIEYPSEREHFIARPDNLEKMLNLARKLSQGIPHLRVDFYSIGTQIYFGELTFFHEAGMGHFYPNSWNIELGKLIELPIKES